MTLQNPIQKVPSFQISEIIRVNINSPVKDKKLFHFAIKLLSEDASKSQLHNLDQSNSLNSSNKYPSNKNISQVYIDKKLEDIYQEVLEQSLNEGNGEDEVEVITIIIFYFTIT